LTRAEALAILRDWVRPEVARVNLGGDVQAGGKAAAAGSMRPADLRAAKPVAAPVAALSRGARVLLWDYERGSLAYDLLCLFLVLLLLLVPGAWWGDPMIARP
jgi:hypothetical protein